MRAVPQGLKPIVVLARGGTAVGVPFPNHPLGNSFLRAVASQIIPWKGSLRTVPLLMIRCEQFVLKDSFLCNRLSAGFRVSLRCDVN